METSEAIARHFLKLNSVEMLTSFIENMNDVADELVEDNAALHKLLDLRDEQYFKFCETGIIEGEL